VASTSVVQIIGDCAGELADKRILKAVHGPKKAAQRELRQTARKRRIGMAAAMTEGYL
jgi:hypothetical protein